jgi:bla regulator protein blaR1
MELATPTPMIKALCWTLIHSLWISLLIALLAGAVLLLTLKASAALRYQLLCGLMLLFVAVTGFTFYTELANSHQALPAAQTGTPFNNFPASINISTAATQGAGIPLIDRAFGYIDHQLVWLFFAWLICLLIKGTRLIGGLFAIQRISSKGRNDMPAEWHEKVLAYSKKLGITRNVRLLQSGRINVPATVGYLKPVILLPLDFLLQLAPGQAESILWHELAHIARRDYLAGLLQEIIEALFFFNPALLWLSELIREEREKCCDDLVLTHTASKGAYLEALLAFQQTGLPLTLAIHLTNLRKGQLRNRLNRIIGRQTPLFSLAELLLLITGLIFVSGLLLMAKPALPVKHPSNPPATFTYNKKATVNTQHETLVKQRSPKVKNAKQPAVAVKQPILSDQQRVKNVIAELVKEKVIPEAATLDWFGLSDTELIVNGEKQPDALQQKLKAMVSVGPGNGLYFGNVKMTGQGVFLEKKEL